MAFSTFFVFYSGLVGKFFTFTYIAIAAILIEGLILLVNHFECPIHTLASKFSGDSKINDTFLPRWVFFKYHNLFFTTIFIIGLVLLIF